jgi:hypothetical protein
MNKTQEEFLFNYDLVALFRESMVFFQDNNGPKGAYVMVPNKITKTVGLYVGNEADTLREAQKLDEELK